MLATNEFVQNRIKLPQSGAFVCRKRMIYYNRVGIYDWAESEQSFFTTDRIRHINAYYRTSLKLYIIVQRQKILSEIYKWFISTRRRVEFSVIYKKLEFHDNEKIKKLSEYTIKVKIVCKCIPRILTSLIYVVEDSAWKCVHPRV